jgi:hypothetical protein
MGSATTLFCIKITLLMVEEALLMSEVAEIIERL